ncbi:MAG: ice-binding family protein, partial [Dokdonella sp.]
MNIFRKCAAALLLALMLCALTPLALAQTSPPLGQSASFAVLGGSAVTNTGPSIVTGELGVSPGTAVTGFPPGLVSGGSIHIADAVALQAQADLVVAYNVLAGQAQTADLTGSDLGGLTLGPGVYRFSSSAQLTGTLTLDAQGDPAAVFIFQIGSTLTTASAANVLLINGGQDCNVYWQIGSSATLGTGTALAGSILALTSITLNTNASITGRLLARNGAVTLDSATVSVCAAGCAPITMAPPTVPNASIGEAYSTAITASGGIAPYVYSLSAGTLPAGLTLSAA